MKSKGKPIGPSTDFVTPARLGLIAIVLLVGGSFTWACFAEISGAVIAQGTVAVRGRPKAVQHVDGGIIETIYVTAGDRVAKGDRLVELDGTLIAANLAIYRGRLRDALARRGRLLAEMAGEDTIAPPDAQDVEFYRLEGLDAALGQQEKFLQIRRQAMLGEIGQYDKKIAQLHDQIAGARAIRAGKLKEIEVYKVERASIEKLVESRIMARNGLLPFDRSVIELRSEIARQDSQIARLVNSISEAQIAQLQVTRQMLQRDAAELDELEVKIDELKQQIAATALQLKRTSILAPVDGIVHELAVHTVGGVIRPAETIMEIVPTDENLEIEVNADTRSVDEIVPGRLAVVRFPAFHRRTTPEIFGRVMQVSPSSIVDKRTGAAFYRVAIAVSKSEIAKLGGRALIPGMPVEAVMPTEKRTVLSYLVKPLADQFTRALREQ